MKRLFAAALALVGFAAGPAMAESTLTPARQTYLEGVWNGIPAEGDASKLCTDRAVNSVTLSIEFLRTGGTAFLDDGTENANRGPIAQAAEEDGIVSLTLNNEVWRFRPSSEKVMMRVRNSASLGADVDTMVFKRCKAAADRTGITLDDTGMKF